MMRFALVFLTVSVISGVIAFTGILSVATAAAEFIFFVAVALFAIFLVVGLALGKSVF